MNSQPHDVAVRVARHAMATRFEILLHGANEAALRAAGEEALAEVDRLEARLSLYRPASEIARVNALAARQPVRVSPPVFQLLQQAQQLHQETGGAFDITVGPLVRCWGFMGGQGRMPEPKELDEARALVGMRLVILNEKDFSVRFDRAGVILDLGAIGKGYAIDCAARLLRECGVTSALLHGGTSTTYALGAPPGAEAWQVGIAAAPESAGQKPPLQTIMRLRDEALSVSAVWGRSFAAGGKTYGHVLDPRTGQPVNRAVLAAVVLPSATETDALSTALLVEGPPGAGKVERLRPGMRILVLEREGHQLTTNH
ncbi:MAG TPA: FAD:protein FMN transferase [Candidatus Acidoferrum sp.]|nr:FAD:protein FMN transferase [Candidatus Acidoferrum sp.]